MVYDSKAREPTLQSINVTVDKSNLEDEYQLRIKLTFSLVSFPVAERTSKICPEETHTN